MASTDGRRRAAVLGSPIAHSLSPVLHRAAYAELGLDGWSYDRFEIDEQALPGFVAGLDGSWAGLSLTMPLKRAIIPLLDEISETASSVEAVNTVVLTEDGRRLGDNTDIPGMIAALRERGVVKTESAAVLGAGATASSALAALSRICTGPVTAYVRSRARGNEMRGWGDRLGVDVRIADWAEAGDIVSAPLVIATTPAGATDELAASLAAPSGVLFDVLYDPWPTSLAAAWSSKSCPVIGGIDLLVHQALLQIQKFTGKSDISLSLLRESGWAALAARGS
ncbi:shikimate dehydrogenase [Streptomyces sp. NPDC050529]|uniref:shikimate dehydrogenase n=1 Tax=unclassified Streptomyces TaxID=2593676 RepID=UPI002DD9A4B1|nr:shikimate dehydrogenase [Streptomyces sp. NBC_01022]WRZ80636.1 shikimate dehydrogenase [Streptomyces sp. NBC_01022]